jgi:hypothetical protein
MTMCVNESRHQGLALKVYHLMTLAGHFHGFVFGANKKDLATFHNHRFGIAGAIALHGENVSIVIHGG